MQDKQLLVNKEYVKSFNLGYQIARELNLKKPLFKNQNQDNLGTNPIQAGMLEFIDENQQSLNLIVKNQHSNPKKNIKDKNNGKGLIL